MMFLHRSVRSVECADSELDSLMQQARYWQEHSLSFLHRAGIGPGMRVLDVGSGAGDFAFLAAELVGATGTVVSVDASPLAVARCTQRAADRGVANVRFIHSDIDSFEPNERFHAVIGRASLMHLPSPACTLQRLATWVLPRGVVAFQEMDMSVATAEPPLPLFDQTMGWIRETYRQASVPVSLGRHLPSIYRAAGLPEASTTVETASLPCAAEILFEYIAGQVRMLLPLMERLEIATPADVQINTLAGRLRNEAARRQSAIVPPALIGIWAQLPPSRPRTLGHESSVHVHEFARHERGFVADQEKHHIGYVLGRANATNGMGLFGGLA